MLLKTHRAMRWMPGTAALALMCALMSGRLWAQQPAAGTPSAMVQTQKPKAGDAAKAGGADPGVVLDRIVAVVNGDLILESDVDEEKRFEEIQPYRDSRRGFSRDMAIARLVDRMLILQQAELEAEGVISDKELDTQLMTVRKDIPECKQFHCETDEGWKAFLNGHGFTVEEFRERWRRRMELLKFIEVRFRNGIHISEEEIKTYYEKTMLPAYAKRNVTPPALETISKRIEEVLLQQQVGALLVDWLQSLRAQGSVRMTIPGEVAP